MEKLYAYSQKLLTELNRPFKRAFLQAEEPFPSRMSILLGQRGTGKTTLLIQYLLSCSNNDPLSKSILYVAADHFLTENTPLYEIAEHFASHSGQVLVLDEIHKYPNWSQELKSIYDSFPKLKVIASGSSALEIHKGSHDLSRRAIKYHLPGLSFREYLALQYSIALPTLSFNEILENHNTHTHTIAQALAPQQLQILPLFKSYLKKGYFPYIEDLEGNTTLYHVTLEQNVHTIIESDLISIYPNLRGNSTHQMKRLLAHIASQTPYKVDFSKLLRSLDIGNTSTLKTYLKYLQDADIITGLCAEGKSLAAFEKPEKIYHANPNQLYALCGDAVNTGTLRETFFLCATHQTYQVHYSKIADFNIEGHIFEVGGKNKDTTQLQNKKGYLALDNLEHGHQNKIPLYLFGFLY